MRLSLALLIMFVAGGSQAATITVNTNSSGHAIGGNCVLRDAIEAANTDSPVGGCSAGDGADTIVLPASAVITLNETDNATAQGENGLPAVTSDIAIEGQGAILDRDTSAGGCTPMPNEPLPSLFRHFEVDATGALALKHLTLKNGCAQGSSTGGYHSGGAVYNAGSLTLLDVTIKNSVAVRYGGAVYNDGALTIDRSFFTLNSAYAYGAAIADSANGHDALIEHSAFVGNSTTGTPSRGEGGAIWHDTGTLTLRNCTFAQNYAYDGSELRLHSGPTLISNTTFAFSNEGMGGGAISSAVPGSHLLKIANSIVYTSCDLTSGYLQAVGDNLSAGSSCQGFTQPNSNPQLSALIADNGVPYYALSENSSAVDAAADCLDATGLITITDDQRGHPRPYGTACDLGAYERDDLLFADGFEP